MTYTEDGLIEQPAINLFSQLNWKTVTCWDETFGATGCAEGLPIGRETRADVVLFSRLRNALTTLNSDIPARILQEAIDEISRDRSSLSPIAANEEVYLGDGNIVLGIYVKWDGASLDQLRPISRRYDSHHWRRVGQHLNGAGVASRLAQIIGGPCLYIQLFRWSAY